MPDHEHMAHWCRDEHEPIRHNDSENERCPLCRMKDRAEHAEEQVERLTREKAVLQEHADGLQSSWRGTYGDVVNQLRAAERERDEAYATVRRVWQALGCERYEDARGMHISELVDELRRDRDRHKAGWLAERERCARVVDTPGEFPVLRWKIAAAIRSLPTPTLPEESGDRDYKTVVDAEREAIAAEARRYASHYPQGSDGRNTFILLAEWIERRAAPTLPAPVGSPPHEMRPDDRRMMDGR
jgi:hypothetical protein